MSVYEALLLLAICNEVLDEIEEKLDEESQGSALDRNSEI